MLYPRSGRKAGRVEIVNLALARLGDAPIQDFDEGSAASNQAKLFYEPSRRAVLRDYNWNFALKIAQLARLAHERPIDFRFVYALPADCLRAVRLRRPGVRDYGAEDPGERFVIRSQFLYTDDPKADLEYVRDVTDESEFDDKFIEAFSYKLAAELAVPLTGRFDLMNSFLNAYTSLVRDAATLTARENRRPLPENPYVDARDGFDWDDWERGHWRHGHGHHGHCGHRGHHGHWYPEEPDAEDFE